ncbi:4239_t:CDS:2 [Dentiscutata heterogama]|uniref:4239_t:CDS:1 n=1 Tax=Dentiscutata heterogama TaxID=1316150 RepID=A0ACA9KIA8_9GLOM|nr:4239_t:CDS:2 [Dentiscutata heterogama]
MSLAPKNDGIWFACTTYTITYIDFSLVYSLSGTPTTPAEGKSVKGNGTSSADFSGFQYVLLPYSTNGTINYCGSSSTVCRFVQYNNYNLPRDYYCIGVINPNNVDYYMTLVYTFGGTEAARRSVDESMNSPKKGIYAREFYRRGHGDFMAEPSIDLSKFKNS